MSLRSQKRNRIYLRKIWYLRNFLNLLRSYRAFLRWKYGRKKRVKRIRWRNYAPIAWKTFKFKLHEVFKQSIEYTVVVYRYFNFRMTATCLISNKPFKFITILDMLSLDKKFTISLRHETSRWKSYLTTLSRCIHRSFSFVIVVYKHQCAFVPKCFFKIELNLQDSMLLVLQILKLFIIFPGQMLLNWFVQTIPASLTSSLNENEMNALTMQYCTNLLIAGIIKPLDTTSNNNGNETFKVK